jgi:5-formyltetrahydrofolate cyclo-ligase
MAEGDVTAAAIAALACTTVLYCVAVGVGVQGVCLEPQLVEAVPEEPHDRRVDIVVTPSRTIVLEQLQPPLPEDVV